MQIITRVQLNQLFRYAVALTNHEDDAFDFVQTGLEKYLASPRLIHSPMAYIRQAIKHQYIDHYRREQKFDHVSMDSVDEVQIIEIEGCSLEDVVIREDEFDKCIKVMTIEEREILFLSSIEGYTAKEIAEETGTPRGTVLSKLHRMKKRIRTLLNQEPVPFVQGGRSKT